MTMILTCNDGGDFKPHPEGIHPGVCIDCIDLGMVKTEFQGQERIVPKLKLVFETEQRTEDGRNCTVSKNFTASLHPKARLAEFIGKWRGRPVLPGESIDLAKLIGASCTLVVSHQQNMVGKTYASIDAVSKPTKRLVPSGSYDPAAARQRIAEWNAKQGAVVAPQPKAGPAVAPRPAAPQAAAPMSKSSAPVPAQSATEDNIPFDPEVGF